MKKLLCWFVLLCLVLLPALTALAEAAEAHTITERTMKFYFYEPNQALPFSVYFIDGSDVPYMSLSDWPAFMYGDSDEYDDAGITDEPSDGVGNSDAGQADVPDDGGDAVDDVIPEDYEAPLTFSMEGSVGRLTRPDGYSVSFDCDADVIHFLDYDAYMRPDRELFLIDPLNEYSGMNDDGTFTYFERLKSSYERYGREVTIDAGDYGIDFIADGGACYVPMQTLGDFLLSYYSASILYNGEVVIVGTDETLATGDPLVLTPLGKLYYSVKPRARSEAMAQFSYNELCMALDALYGLKDRHGIERFDALADDTGLKVLLTGTDPLEADAALYQLLDLHLDDQHTAYRLPSPLSGAHASDTFEDDLGRGQSSVRYQQQALPYFRAREAVYPNGIPAYEEFGNTAYITFDEFITLPEDADYYEEMPTGDVQDTIGILIYAYQQITREDSPIENVVLDLSCNIGGDTPVGVYTLAAFLGVGSISSRNALSGALVTGNYRIDLDLDGRIDDNDTGLLNKNLFCLESPVCFSCGNLVTASFKNATTVTLLGRASGGGACNVQPLSTADGSVFQISGPLQLAFLKNGAFYDIDQGAEPDFPLAKHESFYDREALTEYINQIR